MDPNESIQCYFSQVWQEVLRAAGDFLDWADLANVLEAWRKQAEGPPVSYSAVLPILACGAVGGEPARAVPVAAAWNLFNLASDLLDDLQDGDYTEKQVPWQPWDPARMLQVGLGMMFLGQAILTDTDSTVQALFAETGILAARGQQRFSGTSMEECLQRMAANTGLVFSAAARAGGMAGTSGELVSRVADYGAALGMLIQLADDYVDLIGGTVAPDFMRTQHGLPLVYALNQQQQEPDYSTLLNSLETQNIDEVLLCVWRLGGFHFTAQMAALQAKQAIAALEGLCPPYVDHLRHYVERLTGKIPELATGTK